MNYLKIILGVIGVGIGLLGYLLIGYVVARWGKPIDPWVLAAFGFLGLLATAFLLTGVKGIRNGVRWLPPTDTADRPWLKNKVWRKRQIVHGSIVHCFYLVLDYIFFGLTAVMFIWAAIDPPQVAKGHWSEGLYWSAFIVFILVVLTYWWLRHRRYGNSVCRLLTLPGVVGGCFKADVECALPPDLAEPVIVRLKNLVPAGKTLREVWRMEEKLTVPVSAGKRSVVPVRLRVPRNTAQQLTSLDAGALQIFLGVPRWVLEIEKKTAGVDFFASFNVPIYDTPNAPASEQRTERSLGSE